MADDITEKYRILFKGEIEAGQDLSAVKERLAQLFKAPPERIERLFTGKAVTLNNNLDYTTAQEYVIELKNAGILCTIEPMSESTPPKTMEGAKTLSSSEIILSSISTFYKKSIDSSKKLMTALQHLSFYQICLLLVAGIMVLLPIIYLFLILFIINASYAHIEDNSFLIEEQGPSFGFLAYYTPIIIGILLIAFMIKPLFTILGSKGFSISVSRKKEPPLFMFVEKLCRSVSAPIPSSIEVDCSVRASAGFKGGLLSFLEDNHTLTIGMPLVSEMTLTEFTSILVHEFGHFTKKMGMRLHYLITSVNAWFDLAIYGQDILDKKMLYWLGTSIKFYIRIPLLIAQFFIWLTRKILTLFMLAGHLVSSYFLRQMEFEADRCAIQLAGSEAFEASINKLQLLTVVSKQAQIQVKTQKKPGEDLVPDNFVFYLSSLIRQMSEDEVKRIKEKAPDSNSKFLDPHPTDYERINNANRMNIKGIFQSDKPASSLFSNYEELSKNTSLRLYRDVLGLHVTNKSLVPIYQFDDTIKQPAVPSQSDLNVF